MARQLLMFSLTNAMPGRDEEYNSWYSDVHLGELLRIDGIKSAQRYRMLIGDDWRYVTVYEVEADDPKVLIDDIYRAAGDGTMSMSDSWDTTHYVGIAEPIGGKVVPSAGPVTGRRP